MSDKPRIGMTIGDLNGIGPEVIIKTLSDSRLLNHLTPIIFGSPRAMAYYKKALNADDFNYVTVRDRGQFKADAINVVSCWEEMVDITPGQSSKATGHAAALALKEATAQIADGTIHAMVTAPIDKSSIYSDQFPYRGHTEYLRAQFNDKEPLMLMVSSDLRIGLVTEHIPLREVPPLLTAELIGRKLNALEKSMRNDFGISKPKIAVLALNPHAGDAGLIGKEDDEILTPALTEKKNHGKLFFGPFPSDAFFASGEFRKYDAVLAIYHDQGLIPFKLMAFADGVNFTAGLPFVRTSPDHGTAYPIAGKGVADESSFRNAMFVAMDIVRQRAKSAVHQ